MANETFYLLTTDLFDDTAICDDGSCLNVHENIGLFLDNKTAFQRYNQIIEKYKNKMTFRTKEVSPVSQYPELFTDFDRCFIADETAGGDFADYPVHHYTTLLKIDIKEGVFFNITQDSYLVDFRNCAIKEYDIPIARSIFQDGEKDIPAGLDRIPVIR